MRSTKQREAILKELLCAEGPLSGREIHERSSRHVLGLGMATVYRNIKDLGAQGMIRVVDLPGESPHYEPANRGHHHHSRYLSCEQIFEVEGGPIGIAQGTTLPGGYWVEDHDLTLYGRCAACLD